MIPTTQELARQMAVMLELYPEKTTSEIAGELGYSPLFIINAMAEGVAMGLFTNDREADKLTLATPMDYDDEAGQLFGVDNSRLQDEILRSIVDANETESDIEIGLYKYAWLAGVRESQIEIAIHVLKQIGFVMAYKLKDPADPKSEYEFLTLTSNFGQEWGKKQFKAKAPGKSVVRKKKK